MVVVAFLPRADGAINKAVDFNTADGEAVPEELLGARLDAPVFENAAHVLDKPATVRETPSLEPLDAGGNRGGVGGDRCRAAGDVGSRTRREFDREAGDHRQ